jgi:hypothetical protein
VSVPAWEWGDDEWFVFAWKWRHLWLFDGFQERDWNGDMLIWFCHEGSLSSVVLSYEAGRQRSFMVIFTCTKWSELPTFRLLLSPNLVNHIIWRKRAVRYQMVPMRCIVSSDVTRSKFGSNCLHVIIYFQICQWNFACWTLLSVSLFAF